MSREELDLQRRYMLRKRKSLIENDPKKTVSGADAKVGADLGEVGIEDWLVGVN